MRRWKEDWQAKIPTFFNPSIEECALFHVLWKLYTFYWINFFVFETGFQSVTSLAQASLKFLILLPLPPESPDLHLDTHIRPGFWVPQWPVYPSCYFLGPASMEGTGSLPSCLLECSVLKPGIACARTHGETPRGNWVTILPHLTTVIQTSWE